MYLTALVAFKNKTFTIKMSEILCRSRAEMISFIAPGLKMTCLDKTDILMESVWTF